MQFSTVNSLSDDSYNANAFPPQTMNELQRPDMPDVVAHEYSPLIDSSDMGPGDWGMIASDIGANYHHFDGFVVLTGTDTMAYVASALAFQLESLGKPVVFTGSQIPLGEPYNDARKNLIMSIIFACRDTIHEVTIFFHDRLLRACRTTKVNTSRLKAFDSPNLDPLALIGITIDENSGIKSDFDSFRNKSFKYTLSNYESKVK